MLAHFISITYFVAAFVFILGLKRMTSPVTARSGIVWAGVAMVVATLVTFFDYRITSSPTMGTNIMLMIIAIAVGGGFAWRGAKKVEMTDMPQMIALYNGMGGGAAAAIAAVELFKESALHGASALEKAAAVAGGAHSLSTDALVLGIIGAFIGTVAFSGSLVAWAKLDGRMKRTKILPAQQLINIALFVATIVLGIMVFNGVDFTVIILFFLAALVLGAFIAIPIGGADMPVVISLFNALTGLAVAFEGYVMGNAAMIIAGTVVGSAGTLLTQLMATAMNRPITNVLFSGFGNEESAGGEAIEGEMKETAADDVAIRMAYADQVVIIPGYGMAVAQAQHKVWEMVEILRNRGVTVKFAIHPVAGRMPGHMNVLLAEAGVPYDVIYDMDDVNAEFGTTQVTLVIGANDVVNPSARNDKSSPIYGMPILNADESEHVVIVKRGKGTGFSGLQNPLFFDDKTRMLYGDGQKVAADLITALKQL